MKIQRRFTLEGVNIEDQIKWVFKDALITDHRTGEVIFEQKDVEVPSHWSQTATNILAQKYFRKKGVPELVQARQDQDEDMPEWLRPKIPLKQDFKGLSTITFMRETSAKQAIHRIVGHWTYWGCKMGAFKTWTDARAYYDEMYWMLAMQYGAPNSPQWFNTGLWWAYGIEGDDSGQWTVDWDISGNNEPIFYQPGNSYERPQPHACFIQPIKDDLVNAGGIMDLWVREARLFKHGSGTGTNFSTLRSAGEGLSGGGISSGLMSFLTIGDRAAGAIKSGGTTRRAAKMVCVNVDHPEVEDLIVWKKHEEEKAAAIAVGSQVIKTALLGVHEAWCQASLHPDLTYEAERLEKKALKGGIPSALIHRARYAGLKNEAFDWKTYEADSWEGEAIETVSGQNANNSIRIFNAFMDALEKGQMWNLTARTDGRVMKSVPAAKLWDDINRSSWACADPGLQFDGTINKWHTCKNDGFINASNPCSEYMFLDDTACNLASMNLVKFMQEDGQFDIPAFVHATELWTLTLDISVQMASFPSKEITEGTYNYRTLGLGYANLGGLLMRSGIPYDSPEGRAYAAAITSLMTGTSYKTSGDMAVEIGPFPRWEANKDCMHEVIGMHEDANSQVQCMGQAGRIVAVARQTWRQAHRQSLETGFRNAQVTVIAPTGTIGLLMDCDTTGLEPEFSLVKSKQYSGGGSEKFVNQAVEEGLTRLGYDGITRDRITSYLQFHGEMNTELKPHHLEVFDCAMGPNEDGRYLRPMAHVEMLAAVQRFLSGAASKTVNLPESASVEDFAEVHMQAYKLGVKSVALFRNNCKLSQPLQVGSLEQEAKTEAELEELDNTIRESWDAHKRSFTLEEFERVAEELIEQHGGNDTEFMLRGQRHKLPTLRQGHVQEVEVDDQKLYIRASEYPDGTLGEIFLDIAKDGSMLQAMFGSFAKVFSIAIQHGVPLETLVESFLHTKFEPAGFVQGHEYVKSCTSVLDLVARHLGVMYLNREDLAHVQAKTDPAIHFSEPVYSDNVRLGSGVLKIGAEVVARLEDVEMSFNPTPKSGMACRRCGGQMVWAGTCMKCDNCGDDTGCG